MQKQTQMRGYGTVQVIQPTSMRLALLYFGCGHDKVTFPLMTNGGLEFISP